MASIPIPFSPTLPLPFSTTPTSAFFKPHHLPTSPVIRFTDDLRIRRRRRGLTVVTRAGPNANSYALAFLLPLSLIAATVFTSIKIADKLDQDYFEELEIMQAIKEAEEAEEEDDDSDDGEEEDYDYDYEDDDDDDDDDDDTADITLEEELQPLQPVLPHSRTRNRPKREA